MPGLNYKIILLILLLSDLRGQPDPRFRPFDWVLYSGAGTVSSITEGYTFAYIGTGSGGLKRFNLYGNYFDEPITTAQGLKNNNITAVHFDKSTGLLWVSTPDTYNILFQERAIGMPLTYKILDYHDMIV